MSSDEEDKLLREEIIESQKTQADFLKWKLIAVAAISSIAFGFAPSMGKQSDDAKILTCLIPLLCAYIDLVSLHIMIRAITIGLYLKVRGNHYEKYISMVRERSGANPFVFEAVALHGSSMVFNAIIVVLGFTLPAGSWPLKAYLVSGILGMFATVTLWVLYVIRAREVSQVAEQFRTEIEHEKG
jgi:hypothetical protein